MPAKILRIRRGAGCLFPGHAQDIHVRFSAVPDSPKVLETGTQHLACLFSMTLSCTSQRNGWYVLLGPLLQSSVLQGPFPVHQQPLCAFIQRCLA